MADVLNLIDWAKRLDPNGKTARIIEILSQKNQLVPRLPLMEGNLPTGHMTTIRTGLPTVYYRLLNSGVAVSKSNTTQVTEGCSILEARSNVDVDLAKLNGNTGEFRLSESKAFLEAMAQKTAETIIYGNAKSNPEQFNGLAIRYSDLTTAENKVNIIDAGGTNSNNTSIYVIGLGAETVHGIFPKGSEVGLKHEDHGIDYVSDGTNEYRAYRDWYQWKLGLVVKDWRFVVRIANIDIPALVANTSPAPIFNNLIKATHAIPDLDIVDPVIVMNRTVFQMLDIQARDNVTSGGQLSYDVVGGKRIVSFRGIPILVMDRIVNTETRVT